MAPIDFNKDYYSILGVSLHADCEAIKQQYKKLLLANHPDKLKGKKADIDVQQLQEAYGVLEDHQTRREYNARSFLPQVHRAAAEGYKDMVLESQKRNQALEVKMTNMKRNKATHTAKLAEAQKQLSKYKHELEALTRKTGNMKGGARKTRVVSYRRNQTTEEARRQKTQDCEADSQTKIQQNNEASEICKQIVESHRAEERRLGEEITELTRKIHIEWLAGRAAAKSQKAAEEAEKEAEEEIWRKAEADRVAAKKKAELDRAAAKREASMRKVEDEIEKRRHNDAAKKLRQLEAQEECRKKEWAQLFVYGRYRDHAEEEIHTEDGQRTSDGENKSSDETGEEVVNVPECCPHEARWERVKGIYHCAKCATISQICFSCPRCEVFACLDCYLEWRLAEWDFCYHQMGSGRRLLTDCRCVPLGEQISSLSVLSLSGDLSACRQCSASYSLRPEAASDFSKTTQEAVDQVDAKEVFWGRYISY